MQTPPDNDNWIWFGLLFGLAFPAAAAALFSGFLLVAAIVVPLALLGWLCAKFSDMRANNKNLNRKWELENRPLQGRIGAMSDLM